MAGVIENIRKFCRFKPIEKVVRMYPLEHVSSSDSGSGAGVFLLIVVFVALVVAYVFIRDRISKTVDKAFAKGVDKAMGRGNVTKRTDAIKSRKMDVAFTVSPQMVFDRIIQTLNISGESNAIRANLHVSDYQVNENEAHLGLSVGSKLGTPLRMELDVRNRGGQYVGTADVVSLMVDEHGRGLQVETAERVFKHIQAAVQKFGGQCNG